MSEFSRGLLARYFNGIAVKRLSVVETDANKSHQHEFNGSRPLMAILGSEDRREMTARFIWLSDEQEAIAEDGMLSWYDSRRGIPYRTAEWRLYYYRNGVFDAMKAGDTLFVATRQDGSVMIIVAPADSTIQSQLLWMFGLDQPELEFAVREIDSESAQLDFAVRYILDELGIEPEEPEVEDFDKLLTRFGTTFPTTKVFSELAQQSLRKKIDPRDDPDMVLMAWLEREELLFRRLEGIVVSDRIKAGFVENDAADITGFLKFSLTVQNRRKSRAGQSLELHLESLLRAHDIRFDRGALTENNNRPDFLFPGQIEYHIADFPAAKLTMLGAKSTCKDRWRQVLREADRISSKHLLTLEPRISENQTNQMRAAQLQLVLPASLHETYRESQRDWLMKLSDFFTLVRERQGSK